ncbi:MAG TPA: XRE family transcriptional regulator [Microbacterium sp.]|nr:XRE family transcriptional regulator [Microbacterium sp.]
MTELDRIGPRLRAARRARGWSLDELARRAGMSMSTLSRLEAGKRQASLELLVPLTRQLGIRLDDLVPDERADPRVRRAARRRDGMVIAPLTLEHAPVQAFKVTYTAAAVPPEPRAHDGYEWLYVLSGRVRLVLDDAEHVLEPGEAAEFDTRVPHSITGAGVAAEIVSIFSEAGERIHTRVAEG